MKSFYIVYENFFDENSSLKYTPLLSGVKEDIILSAYAENVAHDFLVETEGLYIYNDGEDELYTIIMNWRL